MAKRVMTVEDSTSLREMVSFTLQEAGYEVIEAEDGKDALRKMSGNPVDVVITDLNMPNMNGIELTRSMRANPLYRYIPILVLTTESQAKRKEEARDAGATGWLVKPFRRDQLLQIVRKVLG